MTEKQGIVVKTRENGWAEVITEKNEVCTGCGSSQCCGFLGANSRMVTRVLNRAEAKPGDVVFVNLGSEALTKSSALLYMVPLAGLIVGAASGADLSPALSLSETGGSVIFGFFGLALGFIITVIITKFLLSKEGFTPVITRVIKRRENSLSFDSMAIDPVCKMLVDPKKAEEGFNYKGKSYYFCDPGCRDTFMKEPEKYI